MKIKDVICFGVGEMAKLYVDFLNSLDVSIKCMIDNDSRKWGQEFLGIPIESPDIVKHNDSPILISCTYIEEITQQLGEYNAQGRICTVEDIIDNYEFCKTISTKQVETKKTYTICFDACDGSKWAGTELWSLRLANRLKDKGVDTFLFLASDVPDTGDIESTQIKAFKKGKIIYDMVEFMEERLPIVLVNNFCKYGLLAAMILKKKYPKLVKIISVLHNDEDSYFKRHNRYEKNVDRFFCVSRRICEDSKKYFSSNEFYYRTQPVDFQKSQKKDYGEILKIGFAARLVKNQKRADLLPSLIDYLEKERIEYELNIAGDGELFSLLKGYVFGNNLSSKVILKGQISQPEMREFWKHQDVYLNISDFEGCSLAMLEAMSYGCVPIVTDVSGVNEVVTDGVNGYICDVGDIRGIAEAIKKAAQNKYRLRDFSDKSIKIIEEKCNYLDYADYWINNVLVFPDNDILNERI